MRPQEAHSISLKAFACSVDCATPIEAITSVIFWTEISPCAGSRKCSFEKSRVNPKNTEFSKRAV